MRKLEMHGSLEENHTQAKYLSQSNRQRFKGSNLITSGSSFQIEKKHINIANKHPQPPHTSLNPILIIQHQSIF
jgi:hypothetical protein